MEVKDMKGITNYERVEDIILLIEGVFEKYSLDHHEKRFIINHILDRINASIQKTKANDMISNLGFSSIIKNAKNILRSRGEEDGA